MAGIISKPITNFIDLADIDRAAYTARAAEQQYQLRDMQMKEVMRQQQEAASLRDIAKQAYENPTPGALRAVAPEEQMGMENLRALGGTNMDPSLVEQDGRYSRREPGKPGGYNPEKHADLLRRGGYTAEANKLSSDQTKMTTEQLEFLTKYAEVPGAWSQVRAMAPEKVRAALPEEFDPTIAAKIKQATLTEYQKRGLAIQEDQRSLGWAQLGENKRYHDMLSQDRQDKIAASGGKSTKQSATDRKDHESMSYAIDSAKELVAKIQDDPYLVGPIGLARRSAATVGGVFAPNAEFTSKKADIDFERLLLNIRQSLPTKFADTHRELERIQKILGSSGTTTPDTTIYALTSLVKDLEQKQRAMSVGPSQPSASKTDRPPFESFFK